MHKTSDKIFIKKWTLLNSFMQLCLIYQSLILAEPSSARDIESLSLGQTKELLVSMKNSKLKVNITYVGMETIYHINKDYTFFIPEVRVNCECVCIDDSPGSRFSSNTDSLNRQCDYSGNRSTTCVRYSFEDVDESVCSSLYRGCCQVYFSKNNKTPTKYTAIFLKRHKSVFKFLLTINSTLSFFVLIFDDIQRLILMDDILFEIHSTPFTSVLPEGWYFLDEDSAILFFSSNINGIDETSLHKIGWFQFKKAIGGPLPIPLQQVKNNLKIQFTKCESTSKYEWKLNATNFYSNGLLRVFDDAEKVTEKYKDSFFDITFKQEEQLVVLEEKNPPNVKISLSSVDSFPFISTSWVILSKGSSPILKLKFLKGSGTFKVEIISPFQRQRFSFYQTVNNSLPYEVNHTFSFHYHNHSWICVRQNEFQLCNKLESVTKENIQISTTESLSTNNCTLKEEWQTNVSSLQTSSKETVNVTTWIIVNVIFCLLLLPGNILFIRKVFLKYFKNKSSYSSKYRFRKGSNEVEYQTEKELLLKRNSFSFLEREDTNTWRTYGLGSYSALLRKEWVDYYKGVTPPVNPLISEITFTYDDFNFELMEKNAYSSKNKEGTTQIRELFEGIPTSNRSKILIHGSQGSGKTSLCFKLLKDWIKGETYMQRFKLVFILEMWNWRYHVEKLSYRFVNALSSVEHQTLLLIDGIDDLNEQLKKPLLELIVRILFPKASFIITTKTTVIDVLDSQLFWFPNLIGECFDKRFKIITSNNTYQEAILRKYVFPGKFYDRFLNNIMKDVPEEIRQVPLLLILIGLTCKKEDLCNLQIDKAEMFKLLFSYIIYKKFGVNVDIMDVANEKNKKYLDLMMVLGKYVLKNLDEKRFILQNFMSPEEKNEILSLDVIRECSEKYQIENKFYKPIHPFILEFAAAYYLWRVRDSNEIEEFFKNLNNAHLLNMSSSQFLHFLFGLFGEEITSLLKMLSPYAHCFSYNLNLWNKIAGYKVTKNLEDSLKPFIPGYILISASDFRKEFYFSKFLPNVLSYSSSKEDGGIVFWNPVCSFYPTESLHLQILRIQLMTSISEKSLSISQQITCKELIFDINIEDEITTPEDELDKLLTMVDNVKSDYISFAIHSSQNKACALIERNVTSKLSKISNLRLDFDIHHKEAFLSLIKIIHNSTLKSLYLILDPRKNSKTSGTSEIMQNDIDSLIVSVGTNQHISDFVFLNRFRNLFSIDLQSLTNKGTKEFNLLRFVGLKLHNERRITSGQEIMLYDSHQTYKKPIRSPTALLVENHETDGDTIRSMVSSDKTLVLGGSIKVISTISKDEETAKNIDELDVYMYNENMTENCFQCVNSFSNLQRLCIKMENFENDFFRDFAHDVVDILKSLEKLEYFQIRCVEKNIPLASTITDLIMESTPPKILNTFILDINESSKDKIVKTFLGLRKILKSTIEPVRQGVVKNLHLIFRLPNSVRKHVPLLLTELFPLKQGFKIYWDLDGRKDGSTRSKKRFHHSFFSTKFYISHDDYL